MDSIQSCHLRFFFSINNEGGLIIKKRTEFLNPLRFATDWDLK
jgi:hypothetical protein